MRTRCKINLIIAIVVFLVVSLFWLSLTYGVQNDPELAQYWLAEPTPEMLYGSYMGFFPFVAFLCGSSLGAIVDNIILLCKKNPRD